MSHAKLSPSAADRWMVCPGSVVLSEGMPEKSSAFAEEGTRAHALAEAWLRGEMFDAPDEMRDHVAVYVNYIRSILEEHPDAVLMVEQRVKVNEQVYGTADAVIWIPSKRKLAVIDLKYGAGVAVEVEGNLQLKIYALAGLLTFGYSATQVTATIVQPRCPHGDGPIRSATYEVVDLLEFHADLIEAVCRVDHARSVNDIMPHLQVSPKGCRWCLAAPKCPKMLAKAQEQAKKVFTPALPYNPESLAETLDFLPLLEAWIKNVREFAYSEAEKGAEIPDWKLVEKRATRKWKHEGTVLRVLHNVAPDLEIFEQSLKTPAAIEKLLPKEQRGLLDELTVKESTGHTLVHDSDRRPAIKVDAASVFGGCDEL